MAGLIDFNGSYEIRINDRISIYRRPNGRTDQIILDGMVVALCPSLESAYTVARALKLYTLEDN